MVATAGGRELEAAGYKVVKEVKLKWSAHCRWYEVVAPNGEECLILRQSSNRWHAFGRSGWTASGSSPERAVKGGLGDAIDTDAQLKSYCNMVLRAPDRLAKEYYGLYEAQGQCFQESGAQMNPGDDDEDERPDFEGNYTITDRPMHGYSVGLDSTHLGEFDDFDKALLFVAQNMEDGKYWPDVYFINDHGNVDLLAIKPKTIKGRVIKVTHKIVKSWV
jgi:hypothetical protein